MNEHSLLILISLHFNPNFKLEYKIRDLVFPRFVIVFYFNTTKEKHDNELCRLIVVYNPSNEEKTTTSFVDSSSSIAHQKKRR
jgi:hypothetical protein